MVIQFGFVRVHNLTAGQFDRFDKRLSVGTNLEEVSALLVITQGCFSFTVQSLKSGAGKMESSKKEQRIDFPTITGHFRLNRK